MLFLEHTHTHTIMIASEKMGVLCLGRFNVWFGGAGD